MEKVRITFILCFLLFTGLLSAQTVKEKKVSLAVKEASLSSTFKKIEEATGIKILFSYDDVKSYKVTANLKNETAEQAVKKVIAGLPLEYAAKDEFISVTTLTKAVKAVGAVIRGSVKDENNEPLPGVAITLPGTNIGTVTNANGEFVLTPRGSVKATALQASYVGMKTQRVPFTRIGSAITIVMVEDSHLLDDVIVTGYQTVSKERATGAFGSVRGEQMEKKLNADLKNVLEGQVAGVVLDKDGNLSIRGISTLSAETAPLIVVDGYPTECSLSDLNPDNIDNVTVLKDGVAASIYGSRSANGVIVVTTKQGKKGKTNISYRGTFKIVTKPDLDNLHMASTSDYIDAELALYDLNPSSSAYNISYRTNNQSKVNYLITQRKANLISDETFNSQIDQLRNVNFLDQMEKYMFRSAFTQTHNVGINGGNDTNRYNLAVNYTNNRSSFINTNDNRLLVDLKNEWNPYKFLTIGVTANISYTRSTAPRTSWQTLTDYSSFVKPYTTLMDENGMTDVNTVSYNKQQLFNEYSGLKDTSYNPIQDAYDDYKTDQNFSARFSGFLRFNILQGLSAEVGGNWQRGSEIYKAISEADSYRMRLAFNNATSRTSSSTHYVPDGDLINETRYSSENWTVRTQLNFNREFGKHRVTALAGNEVRRITYDNNQYATRLGYNSTAGSFTPVNLKDFIAGEYNADMIDSNDLQSSLSNGQYSLRDNRFVSWYFNGSYEYDNRYLVSGSIREDLTNFFGTDPKFRHKPMWSIGGTWKVNNEKFFDIDFINRLNVRASYGVNGNISLSQGPYLILSAGSYSSVTEGVSYGISSYPNNSLRWEKTKTTNIGIDVDFLKNRLGFSFDWYKKKSTDLLASDSMDPTTGATSMTKNVGAIENKGFEIALHATPVKTREFAWSINYNLSLNDNKVLEYNVKRLYPTSYAYAFTVNEAGYPMNGIWGYRFAGLNDQGVTQIYKADGSIGLASTANKEDVYYQGTVTPKTDMSLTNNFTYKNWDLSFMFIAKFGHKYRKDAFSGSNYNSRYVGQRWQKAGDEANTIYPVLKSWNMDLFYFPFCDVNVGNASYAKLRDVTLSYNFDKSLIKRIGMNNARIYLQARNLFRITAKDCDIDPETMEVNTSMGMGAASNGGYAVLPLNPEYYIGVSFTF